MLTGVYQVGKYLSSKIDPSRNPLIDIVEDASDGGRYKHVLKIVLCYDDEVLSYKGIEYEEYSNSKELKYAYKSGPPKGGDYTPISKYVDSSKTIERIIWSIKKALERAGDFPETSLFKQAEDFLSKYKKNIISDIDSKKSEIKTQKNEYFLLCLVIEIDGEQKYPGDFSLFCKRLIRIDSEQYFNKYNKISKGTGICYYCLSKKEVYGFVNTFNSYTVDKKGMVTGGFRQENAWINYPVCDSCAKVLELGKKYIIRNLSSKFSTFDYMVIPKLCYYDPGDWGDLEEVLEMFEKGTKFSTSDDSRNNLLSSEKDFLEIMKETKNIMNYNMLIYREEQSGSVFKILLFIEDIVPSRVKKMLKTKDEVDKNSLYRNLPGKENSSYDLKFTFSTMRKFFPNNKIEGNFDKNYLELLNNIFTSRAISYNFFIGNVVTKLRNAFANDENVESLVLEGLMSIEFINRLKLFKDYPEGGEEIMPEVNEKNQVYLNFIDEHSDVLDSDVKKAVFLTGVLVKKLLNIQFKLRNSQPFYSKLNSLKLDIKLIRKLFTEAINKLNEYDKNYYADLEELIAEYMLTTQTISDDDASFYFTLGMSLARKFKSEKEE